MLGKRLAYLIIASITALTVFVTGCALEEKAEEEQDKNDLNEYKVEIKADPEDAGEISGEGGYEEDEEFLLEAETGEGYKFVNSFTSF